LHLLLLSAFWVEILVTFQSSFNLCLSLRPNPHTFIIFRYILLKTEGQKYEYIIARGLDNVKRKCEGLRAGAPLARI
jgi:hypothetical protein